MSQRRRTATSNFGAGARESHDASPFYARFGAPELSDDDEVAPPEDVAEPFVCGDARDMAQLADASVALVVTSPPYFAGKQYEEELERDGVPGSYLEYLAMLTEVFAECVRVLEPGGRIAVNVANLGRKPYRSLSADVIGILGDALGLLLRGELVWQKAEGASGSCAWGSYRSAANPVLRDITERVVVASKGRFDRARPPRRREAEGLPHRSTLTADEFMGATLDLWSIPPERAQRVGHPAPFPVELPEQLIRLYTYDGDLVLDPFMGSGSTLVAAARQGRRYVGYDLDPDYVALARRRVATEAEAPRTDDADDGEAAARRAERLLTEAGFRIAGRGRRIRGTAVTIPFVAEDAAGHPWWFDVAGPRGGPRGGLTRAETVWRTLGRAAAVASARGPVPLVVVTSELPAAGSDADVGLRAAGSALVFDVVDLADRQALARLADYARGDAASRPLPGFWTPGQITPPA